MEYKIGQILTSNQDVERYQKLYRPRLWSAGTLAALFGTPPLL